MLTVSLPFCMRGPAARPQHSAGAQLPPLRTCPSLFNTATTCVRKVEAELTWGGTMESWHHKRHQVAAPSPTAASSPVCPSAAATTNARCNAAFCGCATTHRRGL